MQNDISISMPVGDFVLTDTGGEPTTIFFDQILGLPPTNLASPMERKNLLSQYGDHVRVAAMNKAKHHEFFAFVDTSAKEEAVFEVIFADDGGYLNMCGHGTIGVATALIKQDIFQVEHTDDVLLHFNTPSGRVNVTVHGGKNATSVSFINVPSFVALKDLTISLNDQPVKGDVCFGGNFFFITPASGLSLDLNMEPQNAERLLQIGGQLLKVLSKEVTVSHPSLDISSIDLVEFYGPPQTEKGDVRNAVVFGEGNMLDLSPCGTGTCAKGANILTRAETDPQYQPLRDKLLSGQPFVHESISGSAFELRLKEGPVQVGPHQGYIFEIRGGATVSRLGNIRQDNDLQ